LSLPRSQCAQPQRPRRGLIASTASPATVSPVRLKDRSGRIGAARFMRRVMLDAALATEL